MKRAVDDEIKNYALAVIRGVADDFGVSFERIMGNLRTKKVVIARREAYRRCREMGLSYPEIGYIMNRDHTTVLYGINRNDN